MKAAIGFLKRMRYFIIQEEGIAHEDKDDSLFTNYY